jgi:hypothetical protein
MESMEKVLRCGGEALHDPSQNAISDLEEEE